MAAPQASFIRYFVGLILILPWLLPLLKTPPTKRQMGLYTVRGVAHGIGVTLWFYAMARIPIAEVTPIGYISPIFVTIGAWMFLGEKPVWLRIVAVAIGFAGVIFVLRPGQQAGIPIGLLFALSGALLTAAIQLILKPMTAKDSSETLVAWNLILMVPIALVPALFVWSTPTLFEWGILAVQGVLGAVAMTLATKAFSLADASLITPFDFLRLPFVALLGFVLFAETVPVTTWIGGAVIFVATLLMARSARRRVLSQT